MTIKFDIEALSERIYEFAISDFHSYCIGTVEELAAVCESPIEVLLGSAMVVGFNLSSQNFIGLPSAEKTAIVLDPQYLWEGYRIDFVLVHRDTSRAMLFIECDGHEFHERTKDQAAHDRKKDRKIQEAGIPILRFTGSEIYRDPHGCAGQVMNFMNKNVDRLIRR